jgi:hypothetical protein
MTRLLLTTALLSACARGLGSPDSGPRLAIHPLPACFHFDFHGPHHPRSLVGPFPDTVTLSPPFYTYATGATGEVYSGALPDTAVPRSAPLAAAAEARHRYATDWNGSRTSFTLFAPGPIHVLKLVLTPKRGYFHVAWREDMDLGEPIAGDGKAYRMPCPP